eukprot:CAMPEP_0119275558 /NCGR_PEP_ID=MMETSP1329-20130426/13963_1 /TAXON_ID=114041 /ORGANISM="Genus nov. species nov., Strain RCC1024" /LENGTH=140 /DNA_ID=CAMNT_0007275945 /DNA_START=115 /DNA_END=534 /DNA_ORIENTATION=+
MSLSHQLILALALALAPLASGHGYMTIPPSRQYEAYQANDYLNPDPDEYGPHSVAAVGMVCEAPGCASRGSPGGNPWSAPGTASSVAQVHGPGFRGVCGTSMSTSLNYNKPSPGGNWGLAPTTTYAPGQVIDVEWCVAAD